MVEGKMMRILSLVAMVLSVGILYLRPMDALAHGTEHHGTMVPVDAQMKKLHAMMPMFSLSSAGMETALEKGDVAALEAEAAKIATAIPGLKKSKPHKNIKQREKFVTLAKNLGETIATTLDRAKKGDLAGAKIAFKKVEETCAACHAKFRD
jgi:soluble cytochrome b562